VFEKNILQKLLAPKTEERSGNWKNLHKDDRHILDIVQCNLSDHVKDDEKAGHEVRVTEIT
jgi:hypothetical protein